MLHWMDVSLEKLVARVVLGATVLASALLIFSSALPIWGERHLPNEEIAKPLPLPVKQTVEQTVVWEHQKLDSLVVWFDPSHEFPSRGSLKLEVGGSESAESILAVSDVTKSGMAIFKFPKPVSVGKNKAGSWNIRLIDADARFYFQYQVDDSIYSEGELIYHPNLRKIGDLSWQTRYIRPALGRSFIQWGYAGLILFAGIFIVKIIKYFPWKRTDVDRAVFRKKLLISLGLFIVVSLIYGSVLLRSGTWIGPTDFSKDVAYVRSSSESVKAGQWPTWSHYTCGGMQMIGNPEGNTMSVATIFGLLPKVSAENALWLTLILEAGIAAAGAFLLARALGISKLGSVLTAIITSLSAVYAFKIAEGISMVGGAVAYAPWAWYGFIKLFRTSMWPWALLSALSLLAMFWRGDVHIIIGVLAVMVWWAIYDSYKNKSWQKLIGLLLVGSFFFLGASVKVLPFLEQTGQMNSVTPHSIQITAEGLWDDALWKIDSRAAKIPVLHGLPAHYGYLGSYVGFLPLALAVVGLLSPSRHRWKLLGAVIIVVLLVEGTLYEYIMRHIVPLDSLLRMPSRLFTLLVLLIGILAGVGIDSLRRYWSRNVSWKKIFVILVVLFVGFDLGVATYNVLNDNAKQWSTKQLPLPKQPTLAPHSNFSLDEGNHHPSELIAHGYLLPNICGDMNNPPEFLSRINNFTPITEGSSRLEPNQIRLSEVDTPAETNIRTRFVSSWTSDSGTILPADDGSILLVSQPDSSKNPTLTYLSPTVRVQQILFLLIIIVAVVTAASLIQRKRNREV